MLYKWRVLFYAKESDKGLQETTIEAETAYQAASWITANLACIVVQVSRRKG
jgi:hypothetical protein